MNEKLLNKIIAVAYKDANIFDLLHIKYLSKKDKKVAELLEQYSSTADSIHKMPKETVDNKIIENVFDITKSRNSETFFSKLYGFAISKPLISFATSLLVVAIIVRAAFISPAQPQYSKVELRQAEREVKSSLALIGKVFNGASNTLTEEILPERVGKPIKQGVSIVNNLFTKEK